MAAQRANCTGSDVEFQAEPVVRLLPRDWDQKLSTCPAGTGDRRTKKTQIDRVKIGPGSVRDPGDGHNAEAAPSLNR